MTQFYTQIFQIKSPDSRIVSIPSTTKYITTPPPPPPPPPPMIKTSACPCSAVTSTKVL